MEFLIKMKQMAFWYWQRHKGNSRILNWEMSEAFLGILGVCQCLHNELKNNEEGRRYRSLHPQGIKTKLKIYALVFYQKPATSNILRDKSFVSLYNFKSAVLRAMPCFSSVHSRRRHQDTKMAVKVQEI